MLKGIDPLLGPEFLAALRAMGHGDEIAIVDANFPAAANARRLIRCDGHGLARVLDAVLPILPLDDFDEAVFTMQVVGDADARPEGHLAVAAALHRHGVDIAPRAIERSAFYTRSAAAFAIAATGETLLYGNVILRKGVIRPE